MVFCTDKHSLFASDSQALTKCHSFCLNSLLILLPTQTVRFCCLGCQASLPWSSQLLLPWQIVSVFPDKVRCCCPVKQPCFPFAQTDICHFTLRKVLWPNQVIFPSRSFCLDSQLFCRKSVLLQIQKVTLCMAILGMLECVCDRQSFCVVDKMYSPNILTINHLKHNYVVQKILC